MDDVGLRRISVADVRNVAEIDHRAVDALDRQIPERPDRRRGVVEIDDVFEGPDLLGADRRDQILGGERVGDILPGEVVGPHLLGIEVDLDLAEFAAERIGHRRPRHGDDRHAHEVQPEVKQRLLGQPLAREGKLDDGDGRGVIVKDQRRQRAGRHLPQQRLRNRGHLRVGGANVGALLEEDFDDTEAAVGIGLDVLDVVDCGRQRPLELREHAAGHLLRRQAGIGPDRRNHRDPDFGKNVDRCTHGRERPHDHKEQREHDKRIWPPQRNADNRGH